MRHQPSTKGVERLLCSYRTQNCFVQQRKYDQSYHLGNSVLRRKQSANPKGSRAENKSIHGRKANAVATQYREQFVPNKEGWVSENVLQEIHIGRHSVLTLLVNGQIRSEGSNSQSLKEREYHEWRKICVSHSHFPRCIEVTCTCMCFPPQS